MTLPTYNTGTVGVANGGTTVTGVGTVWSGVNVREGDFFARADGLAVVTEVTDTTHLQITPWPGATVASGGAYTIHQNFVGRVVGVAAAEDVATLIATLGTAAFLAGDQTFSGKQTFSNTTEATGAGTTAAALFAGGVEIAKKLYVAGAVSLASTLAVTGVISGANGTVALPSYTFASDPDSGIYRIGANNIGIAVNGAKVLDISTAGLAVTGTLAVTGASTFASTVAINAASPQLTWNKTASGGQNILFGDTGGLHRWAMLLGTSTPESGANAGSNFTLLRYTDAGASLGIALSVVRSSGLVSITNALSVGSTLAVTGATTLSSTLAVTSSSASALAVGRNGATDPALQVDASTASSATGLKIKSAAAAGTVALSAISSGTNESFYIDAKGTGILVLNATATGSIYLQRNTILTGTLTASSYVSAVGLKTPVVLGTTAALDASGQTGITLAVGAPSTNAVVAAGGGYHLIAVAEVASTGNTAVFICGNGTTTLVSQTSGAGWTAGTTPGASFSLGYATSNYRIYNGTGGSRTFTAVVLTLS